MATPHTKLQSSGKEMRICAVSPLYPHVGFIEGGAFLHALVSAWREQGACVDVIAPLSVRQFYRRIRARVTQGSQEWREPPAARWPYASIGPLSARSRLVDRMERRSLALSAVLSAPRDADEVDVWYGKFLAAGAPAALQLRERFGGIAVADIGESDIEGSRNRLGAAAAEEIVRSLDAFVCVSDELAEVIISLGARPERVLVEPNAPDTEVFRPAPSAWKREAKGIPRGEFVVGFVGHFIDRKGPLRALAAIEAVDGCRGIFIGRGGAVPSGDSVLFSGAVPHSELADWLQCCDAFVLPTLAEGSSNAIAEAMACGLPIVSSNIPAVRKQVPSDAGFLVDPMDVDALADALIQLRDDPQLRARMADAAVKRMQNAGVRGRAARIVQFLQRVAYEEKRAKNASPQAL